MYLYSSSLGLLLQLLKLIKCRLCVAMTEDFWRGSFMWNPGFAPTIMVPDEPSKTGSHSCKHPASFFSINHTAADALVSILVLPKNINSQLLPVLLVVNPMT